VNIETDGPFKIATESSSAAQPKHERWSWRWEAWVARMEHLFARSVAWMATRMWQLTVDWRAVRPTILRASAHLAILTLAVATVVVSGLHLPTPQPIVNAQPGEEAPTAGQALVSAASIETSSTAPKIASKGLGLNGTGGSGAKLLNGSVHWVSNDATLVRLAQPHTEIPIRPRLSVITHTVQAGETVQSIADLYRLNPTTILWSNPKLEEVPDLLRIGQHVVILPVDGVYHTVAEDDTLESIAEKYKVEVEAITGLSYNDLRPPLFLIQPGMKLILPGGTKPYVPRRVTSYSGPVPTNARGTGAFVWPVSGSLTQLYWWGHRAIDIGAPTGSAVVASDGGYVSFVGWTDIGYGYLIILDHANGYSSYYAHLSQMYVMVGQQVERGQVIGAVGSTGNSTGPHLHLEIRYNGNEQNPLVYLP
jgi:murein DD-endopeptidase MepM/ murein hydrolase activator NlpD